MIAIATLAVGSGCQGPHAIAQFAASLTHGQRRRLGCRRRPGHPRQVEVPCERAFYRLFESIDSDELQRAFTEWMATLDRNPERVVHLDGKVLRNAAPAQPRLRDHTQREDHCRVRHISAACNLSLMRSNAIFLFERQRQSRGAKASLPDWQLANMRRPATLISLLTRQGG